MKHIYLFLLLALFSVAFSQKQHDEDVSSYRPTFEPTKEEPNKKNNQNPLDTVKITHTENEKIDSLSDALATFYGQDVVPANGHRIQVYTGNSEKKAREAQAWIKSNFGDQYVVYVKFELQWRVRVGDFLDPLRAHRLYVQLKEQFPNALKVEDIVNVKKVK